MMTNKGNSQERLICPYNKAHTILKDRMQVHLVKCARNYPGVKIVSCPYNTVHRVQVPELHYHATICPDRLGVDKIIYKPENAQGAEVLFPMPKLDVQPAECWDDAPEVPTYDPEEHCKKLPILRNNIHTQSAAKRRHFRMEERSRLQQIEDNTSNTSFDQPLGRETLQKSRRPIAKSVAMNDDSRTDFCDLREEVTKSAGIFVTPKVPLLAQNPRKQPQPAAACLNDYGNLENNFSSMNIDDNEAKPTPWNSKPSAQNNLPLNYSLATRGVGRGSFLARK